MQRIMVIHYRRFGTICRFHLQGSLKIGSSTSQWKPEITKRKLKGSMAQSSLLNCSGNGWIYAKEYWSYNFVLSCTVKHITQTGFPPIHVVFKKL
jgi:hypothetical protein